MKKSPKKRSAKNVNVPSRNTATSTIHVEPLNSSRVGQEHFDNSSRVWRKKMRMRSSHPFFFATKRISSRIAPMIDHSMIQSCKFPDGALAGSAVAGVSAVAVGAALLFVSFMFELSFFSSPGVWRRGRDSNPRKLALQRFSRPPHSTTLPPLRYGVVKSIGRTGGIRTPNRRFWRPLLYQLNYRPTQGSHPIPRLTP
jgi:hypothetical protein